jgi:hypothetical protein
VKINIRTIENGNVEERSYDVPANLTYRERRLIRELTGLAGIDWITAVDRIDDDVALGLAGVALHRAGKYPGADAMLDMEIEAIELDYTDEIEALAKAADNPPAEAEAAQEDAARPRSSAASKKSTTRRRSGTPS